MILGWHGERKRVVYEGEEIGLLYLVEPRVGPIRGYWRRPDGEVEALGEWADPRGRLPRPGRPLRRAGLGGLGWGRA